mmetsp:Transcript_26896/g.62916  ORF Transcript_26896/g.62916 Transcript_26896/m.62916 type:complete len:280 (-) Transcript_26896:25-864(-)
MSLKTQSRTVLSKSSPPRCVSPPVALTSNTPLSMARTDTSKVPPPRSKMTTLLFSASSSSPSAAASAAAAAAAAAPSGFLPLCSPYARAAAVGSLMMRFTWRPAIRPASLVAWRCWLLKWAGTVITALSTLQPRCCSAAMRSSVRIMAEISSGQISLVSPRHSTRTAGSPCRPSTMAKGWALASDSTAGSWNDRPMIRFTSYTVLRGLVATCALAEAPTIFPEEVKATQLGMVRPDGVGMTSACWVWSFHTARHEYVVPRSIPMMGPGMVAIRLQSVSL